LALAFLLSLLLLDGCCPQGVLLDFVSCLVGDLTSLDPLELLVVEVVLLVKQSTKLGLLSRCETVDRELWVLKPSQKLSLWQAQGSLA
jgi:hypothetical protein